MDVEFKFVDEVEVVELRVKSLMLSESWALVMGNRRKWGIDLIFNCGNGLNMQDAGNDNKY